MRPGCREVYEKSPGNRQLRVVYYLKEADAIVRGRRAVSNGGGRTYNQWQTTVIFTAILLQPVGGQIELKLESLLGRISGFAVLNNMERRRRAKRKKESL